MKRSILPASLLTLLLVLPAAAQPPFAGAPGEPGERGLGAHLGRVLAEFLHLTQEQIDAATALRAAARQQAEPLRGQLGDLHGQLRDLLAADPADAAAIGQAVLSIQAVRDQLQAIGEGLDADFRALLSAEQLQRYEAFRAAREALGRGRGGRRGAGGRGAAEHGPGGRGQGPRGPGGS